MHTYIQRYAYIHMQNLYTPPKNNTRILEAPSELLDVFSASPPNNNEAGASPPPK